MILRMTTAPSRNATMIPLFSGLLLATATGNGALALTSDDTMSWAGKVKGLTVAPVSFPGSEAYSFVTSPSMTRVFSGVPTKNAADLTGVPGSNLSFGVIPSRQGMGIESDLNLTPRSGVNAPNTPPKVGLVAEYWAQPGTIRLRAEGKMGLLGSNGFGGVVGADYVHRLSDAVVIAGGPRLAMTGNDYSSNVYGITLTDPMKLNRALAGRPDTMRFVGAGASLNLNGPQSTSATIYATFDRMMLNTTDITANKNLPPQNQFSFGAQFNYNFGGR